MFVYMLIKRFTLDAEIKLKYHELNLKLYFLHFHIKTNLKTIQ